MSSVKQWESREAVVAGVENGDYELLTDSHRRGYISKIIMMMFASGILTMIFMTTLLPLLSRNEIDESFGPNEKYKNFLEAVINLPSWNIVIITGILLIVCFSVLVYYLVSMHLKLSSKNKRLILHGEEVTAHIDDIFERKGVYCIHCLIEDGKYAGMHLKSTKFRVRPLSTEDRRIRVFIDPANPKKYFVDIFCLIPRKGGAKMQNRSGLKQDPQDVTPVVEISPQQMEQRIKTARIIVAVALFVTMHIFGIILAFIILPLIPSLLKGGNRVAAERANLLANGYYVDAKVVNFYSVKNDDTTTYYLEARYVEPNTKAAYNFRTSGPSSMGGLLNQKIRVYVNPENMGSYIIDIDRALNERGFTAKELA